jgi:hypothetical protein
VPRADKLTTFGLKSGSFKLVETSGLLQDCNGIAFVLNIAVYFSFIMIP